MTVPPLWKVRRELDRAGAMVWRGLRAALFEPPRQFLYDRHSARRENRLVGKHALKDRVAVLVLFQPKGLAGSVQMTLDHLVAEGWSIVVVSNAPLSGADTAMVVNCH